MQAILGITDDVDENAQICLQINPQDYENFIECEIYSKSSFSQCVLKAHGGERSSLAHKVTGIS